MELGLKGERRQRCAERCGREAETLLHFGSNEDGGALVATVCVFLVDGGMVLQRVLAALQHHGNERLELGVCVVGVVCMGWALWAEY